MGDYVSPLVHERFRDLFEIAPGKNNYPVLVVFPQNNRGTIVNNPESAITAFKDVFGLGRYGLELEIHNHVRLFDPNEGVVRTVASRLQGGKWKSYDWVNGRIVEGNLYGVHKQRWESKHDSIDLFLRALERNEKVVIPLTTRVNERLTRLILDRIDLTIEENLLLHVEDVEKGRKWGQQRNAVSTSDGPVVEGINLAEVTSPVKIEVKLAGGFVRTFTVLPGDKNMLGMVTSHIEGGGEIKIVE